MRRCCRRRREKACVGVGWNLVAGSAIFEIWKIVNDLLCAQDLTMSAVTGGMEFKIFL
jgi:hypothetical protein